jgi:uncharacterized protein YyaL (SSP411 family)
MPDNRKGLSNNHSLASCARSQSTGGNEACDVGTDIRPTCKPLLSVAHMSVQRVLSQVLILHVRFLAIVVPVVCSAVPTLAWGPLAAVPTQAAVATPLSSAQDGSVTPRHTNRLINEKSPYLLLHADNPVDWYPWGIEAFEKARREHKPVFLSIGYYTCHWCHVMERESYSSPEIAAVLNQYFVAIKVDREERPDIDRLYLAYLETTTNSGGWPLNVFLTPDRKPFLAGIYFPPDKLKALLLKTAETWTKDSEKVADRASRSTQELLKMVNRPLSAKGALQPTVLDKAFQQIAATYDRVNGGFEGAPKFPRPVTLNFLLRTYARTSKREALDMVLSTLRAMAEGGIHDPLGGGFHRYATDTQWRVPHFEKMLPDQAQLAVTYTDAYQITHDPFFSAVARDILDFSLRELQVSRGGFASAVDADSAPVAGTQEIQEGAFYTWTADEIQSVLGPQDAVMFDYRYGVKENGNLPPQESGLAGKNVLYEMHTAEDTAKHFGMSTSQTAERLAKSLRALEAQRSLRPRPLPDDKIVTAWNGIMVAALAHASQVFDEPRYLATAESTAQLLRSHLYDPQSRRLWRSYSGGSATIDGFLDDYAGLIDGLLELYQADFNIEWLQWAVALEEKQDELFWDSQQGGYFDATSEDPSLLARTRESYDGAWPSPNSTAAMNLLRLAQITDRDDWRDKAGRTVAAFGALLASNAEAVPAMASALDFDLAHKRQVLIAGVPGAADTCDLLRLVNERFLPNKILLLADDSSGQQQLARWLPFVGDVHRIQGRATAYICDNYACKLPTADLNVAARILDAKP